MRNVRQWSSEDPYFARPRPARLGRGPGFLGRVAARSDFAQAIEYARRVLAVEDSGSPLAEKVLLLLDKLIPENNLEGKSDGKAGAP